MGGVTTPRHWHCLDAVPGFQDNKCLEAAREHKQSVSKVVSATPGLYGTTYIYIYICIWHPFHGMKDFLNSVGESCIRCP